jgi:hypothetical protein
MRYRISSWINCRLACQNPLGIVFCLMEQVKAPSKALFVFGWGVLVWGSLTALVISLFDWYTTHQIGSPYDIVGRFVIFMAAGILWGLIMWNRRKAIGQRKLTLTGGLVRLVLFIGLMLRLAIALFTMARH